MVYKDGPTKTELQQFKTDEFLHPGPTTEHLEEQLVLFYSHIMGLTSK